MLDTLSCPSDYSSAIVELRATILEVLVRLAQGMEGFPKGLAVGITSVMPLVNGGHFGNIYRVAGSEWCLKEPRRGREMPVRLPTGTVRAVYSIYPIELYKGGFTHPAPPASIHPAGVWRRTCFLVQQPVSHDGMDDKWGCAGLPQHS